MFDKIKNLSSKNKIIIVVAIACYIVAIITGVNAFKYRTEKKVEITGTVSQIIWVSNDGENSSDSYQIFADYNYGGKNYTDILVTQTADCEYEEGDQIVFEVFANSPDKVATNTFVNMWFFVAAGVLLTLIGVKSIKDDKKKMN